MHVSIQVPDEIGAKLSAGWSDLPRQALEALAVTAYRNGILTTREVRMMLGHSSRWATDEFLHNAGVAGYTEDDYRDDLETLQGLSTR